MPPPRDALPYIKSETVRGTSGYYRVGQRASGEWWLIDPDNKPFFARAVNEVNARIEAPFDPIARLRAWGFNTLGAGASPGLPEDGFAVVVAANFASSGAVIRAEAVRLPDVFDPGWKSAAMQRASEVCPGWAGRRDLLGWLGDDGLGWGSVGERARPSLLQICLSLEPTFAAYHAAWEFALAPYAGDLSRLAEAWECSLENKERIRELTRSEQGFGTAGHARDNIRWTREFAHRYFAGAAAAIRAHDPNHLFLGARDPLTRTSQSGEQAWLAECVYPAVDVAWVNTSVLDGASPGPLIAGDFFWSEDSDCEAVAGIRKPADTSVERMLRRGRTRFRETVSNPRVVGYAWERWLDEPIEQPPFARGLIHVNGVEAREHTELLSQLNGRLPRLRRWHANST